MSTRKKIRSHPLNNQDENHNFEKTNPGLGYSTLTRTISIPNVLLSTLQIAASEFTIDPITSSYNHPLAIDPVTTSYKHPPVSANCSSSMAEKRRGKVLPVTTTSFKSDVLNGQLSPKACDSSLDHPMIGRQKKAECLPKDIKFLEKLSFQGSDSISKYSQSRYDAYKLEDTSCICQREKKIVWCLMCGFHTTGNVLMTCPSHKRVLYGMYICGNPMCKAPRHLVEKGW